MGDKEDTYENRADGYRGESSSPPYEGRFSEGSSPGGRNDDRYSRYGYEERLSPGYDQGSRQYSDYRKSPARTGAEKIDLVMGGNLKIVEYLMETQSWKRGSFKCNTLDSVLSRLAVPTSAPGDQAGTYSSVSGQVPAPVTNVNGAPLGGNSNIAFTGKIQVLPFGTAAPVATPASNF
ncbi:hypothetical protein V6N13_038965 [Hibiscus sabdariffa]|uniref:Uncharacterized protein n=1 Tax=Hibiscus sabdariffa TaxID=183260 RepID=A0ABR2SWW2_9ROSI